MTTLRALLSATLIAASFSVALAKLPPPPMDSKATAAAEEKAAKAAAAASQAKGQLAKVEARVVARYIAEQKAKGIVVTPQIELTAAESGTVKDASPQREKDAHHPPSTK